MHTDIVPGTIDGPIEVTVYDRGEFNFPAETTKELIRKALRETGGEYTPNDVVDARVWELARESGLTYSETAEDDPYYGLIPARRKNGNIWNRHVGLLCTGLAQDGLIGLHPDDIAMRRSLEPHMRRSLADVMAAYDAGAAERAATAKA